MSTYIDIEIIQALPFANANRDDAGQPKTTKIGGTTRGRLSSQSLKRAARFYNADRTTGLGFAGDTSGGAFYRTRYIKQLLTKEIEKKNGGEDALARLAETLTAGTTALGKVSKKDNKADTTEKGNVLILLTQQEISDLADAFIEGPVDKKTVDIVLRNSGKQDLALWGRFFASSDAATLDGSAQVAHAFTTHPVTVEEDFFVGLDDAASLYSDHAGAGHPGFAFYSTGTFYKYANINLEETILNLLNARVENKELVIDENASEETIQTSIQTILRDFITSFTLSVPQGKIRSTAHQTIPHYVRVSIRNDRPVNGATAFDEAIPNSSKNIPLDSIEKLEKTHKSLEKFVGSPEHVFTLSVFEEHNNSASLNELTENVLKSVKQYTQAAYSIYTSEGE